MLLQARIRKMLVEGTQWAMWQGYHVPVSEDYFVIWTPAGTEMHWLPRTWISEKHSLFYFWPGEWYTIQVSYGPDGQLLGSYCDVVLPGYDYSNTAEEMVYTDLYIDVVLREDGNVYTKDHEVFERAARHFPIVEESRQKSFETLDWLEAQAKQWSGPFERVPRRLPRLDFESLSPEEAVAILRLLS